MKIVIRKASIALMCILSHFTILLAQDQQWEGVRGPLAPPDSYEVGGVVSDGYGQHVVTTSLVLQGPATAVTHYLFGNNGETIWSHVFTNNDQRSTASSITSFAGTVSLVFGDRSPNSPFLDYIRLSQTVDGGATWSNLVSYLLPVSIQVAFIDAFADQFGVHIVFSDQSEVYYARFRPNLPNPWTDLKNISSNDLPPGYGHTGKAPKILTNGNKVVVSFVTPNGSSPVSVATRGGDMTTDPYFWDLSVRPATFSGFDPTAQSIAQRGNEKHLMMVASGNIRTSVRIGENGWSEPTFFDFAGTDEFQNRKRKIVSFGSILLTCYSVATSVSFRENTSGSNWSSPFSVTPPGLDFRRSTLCASRTGAYVFWNVGQAVQLFMRRKVYAFSGSIAENMFWTGNNWLSGDVTIESGATVTVKSGAKTHILNNVNLTISPGASLIVEQGSTFYVGNGSSVTVRGKFHALAGGGTPIVFTLESGGTSWSGITVANPSLLNSVDFLLDNVEISGVDSSNPNPDAGKRNGQERNHRQPFQYGYRDCAELDRWWQ